MSRESHNMACKKWREANSDYYSRWQKENRDKTDLNNRKYQSTIQYQSKYVLREIKKKRDKDTDLTVEFLIALWDSQKGLCSITSKYMDLSKGRGLKPNTPSLDRIDSTVGYKQGNVRWLCMCVNMLKGKMSDAEMKEWALAIVKGLQ